MTNGHHLVNTLAIQEAPPKKRLRRRPRAQTSFWVDVEKTLNEFGYNTVFLFDVVGNIVHQKSKVVHKK